MAANLRWLAPREHEFSGASYSEFQRYPESRRIADSESTGDKTGAAGFPFFDFGKFQFGKFIAA
jgi:hypothetical protein